MALISCTECNTEVSSTAATCPKCGARVKPKAKVWRWVLGVPVALFASMMVIGTIAGNSPEGEARARDRYQYETCLKNMRDELKSPLARNMLRGACESMRDEYIKNHGREP